MTLYGIPPSGFRRHLAPESGREHAHLIADTAHSWWTSTRGSSGDRAIAVGTLAALALAAPTSPQGPDYGEVLIPLDDEGLLDVLRATWNSFYAYSPALAEAARPLHDWLSHPSAQDSRGLADYARHLVRAGLLEYCSDTGRAESDDILGQLITRIRSYAERQGKGEFFTPAIAADSAAEITFATSRVPGELFLEPAAGTGTMARSAAAALRACGMNPAGFRWWLNDVDSLNSACCAVNAQLWRLGPHVTVSCGDALGSPERLAEEARRRAGRAIAAQKARPVLYPTARRSPFWPV